MQQKKLLWDVITIVPEDVKAVAAVHAPMVVMEVVKEDVVGRALIHVKILVKVDVKEDVAEVVLV